MILRTFVLDFQIFSNITQLEKKFFYDKTHFFVKLIKVFNVFRHDERINNGNRDERHDDNTIPSGGRGQEQPPINTKIDSGKF